MSLIQPSIACSIDSTIYPVISYTKDSIKLVTITEKQQMVLTSKMLELNRCKILSDTKSQLIEKLEKKTMIQEELINSSDSIIAKKSIMLDNKDKVIYNLQQQYNKQKSISDALEANRRRHKRKLLGWKIGAFTASGVLLAGLVTSIVVLAK